MKKKNFLEGQKIYENLTLTIVILIGLLKTKVILFAGVPPWLI